MIFLQSYFLRMKHLCENITKTTKVKNLNIIRISNLDVNIMMYKEMFNIMLRIIYREFRDLHTEFSCL